MKKKRKKDRKVNHRYWILGMVLVLSALFSATNVAAANNSTSTNSSFNESFKIESGSIDSRVSVNQFGETIANLSAKYQDNSTGSRTFDVKVNGNVSEILDTPSRFTLFRNQSEGFPVVANIPLSQEFGTYNGSLNIIGRENSNFSDSVNVSVEVVDDVKPTIVQAEIGDVQATESKEWVLNVEDNLKVANISGTVYREVEETQGNDTVLVNETVEDFVFQNESTGSWTYTFSKTGEIGQYYLSITTSDESGNTDSDTVSFQVEGLDSVSLLDSNFVFDTIRPKEDTSEKVVSSSIEGKEIGFKLKNLSYGGNETVRIGVLAPGADSPEILDKGERRSFTEKGDYSLVLLHSGNNEVKGTHRVTGEVKLFKPEKHIAPVEQLITFSGTVKNLDKPPAECLKVAEFDACIGYSFDSVKKMFEEENGVIGDENKSYAWKISRVPTEQVEGSDEWKESTSFTMGEYNKTLTNALEDKEKAENKKDGAIIQRNVAVSVMFLFIFITLANRYGKGTMEVQKRVKESNIGQIFENREEAEDELG